MGRVVKPIVVVEIILLATAFAAGLTVIISILGTENELPKVKCLPYAELKYHHNPPHLWFTDVFIKPPDSNGQCDYCLFSQITVVVVALASALYRLVTVFARKCDLSFLRTLSVPLYALCTLGVLVEGVILQVGVNGFIGSVMEYDMKPKTCDLVQAELQKLADRESQDLVFYFCTELNMATAASWISTFCWLALTVLAGVQFYLQRHENKMGEEKKLITYGSGEDEQT